MKLKDKKKIIKSSLPIVLTITMCFGYVPTLFAQTLVNPKVNIEEDLNTKSLESNEQELSKISKLETAEQNQVESIESEVIENTEQDQVETAELDEEDFIKKDFLETTNSQIMESNGGNLLDSKVSVEKAINETAALMYKNTPNPNVGTLNGEWTVLSLARSGYEIPKSYYDNYYNNVVQTLQDKDGILDKRKYTEYSRVILGLTSIGKDITNVGGYNLLEKLSDFNKVKYQGINGPIFALIALDTNNYDIPTVEEVKVQTTREMLIDFILSKEITDENGNVGGWALSGSVPDPDITAMALQALAKYKDEEKVKPYVDRALDVLSTIQLPAGGYSSWGSVNSESIAQVIVALTSLGIDPAKDERFIKSENKWTISAIMDFYVEGGGFKHTLDGDLNAMATDQGMYALVAYDRFKNEKTNLYDMTDMYKNIEEENKAPAINAKDITVEVGEEVDFLKDVTATDKEDVQIEDIKVEHTVPLSDDNKTTIAGTYGATYSAKDSKGSVGTKTIKVIVKEKLVEQNEAPVIDTKDITVEVGDEIDFLKDVTAKDRDGKKIEKIEVKHTVLLSEDNRTTTSGTYSATYSATDSEGIVGTKAIKVIVKEKSVEQNEAPVINAKDITVKVGDVINLLKDVTAIDKEDGKIEEIKVEHTVPLSEDNKATKAGTYRATYSATDSKGAVGTKTVNVIVKVEQNEAPVINAKDIVVELGDEIDFLKDVTATDKEDGKISPKYEISDKNAVVSNVAVKAGKYKVTYTAKDSKGATGTKTVNLTINPNNDMKIGTTKDEISEYKKYIVRALENNESAVKAPEIKRLKDGKYLYTIKIPKNYMTIKLILSEEYIKPEIKGVKEISAEVGQKIDLLKGISAQDGLEVPVRVEIENESSLPIKYDKVTKSGRYQVRYTARRGNVETTKSTFLDVKPISTDTKFEEYKLIGSTRYETAIKVSQKGWKSAENIILVSGNSIPDALAATPFAKQKDAPILLTNLYKLNEDTKTEIKRLKAKNAFVIGGDGVVSEGILSELRQMGVEVERIAGDTRFETSLAIAKKMTNVSKIAIVNGETGLSDATSIASVAGVENMPILLMPTKGINIYDEFIKANNIKKSYVIGGVGTVSKALENTLPNTERIGGANRTETNAKVIEKFYDVKAIDNMFICKNGSSKEDELIDALSVGALAAKENSPVVIVDDILDNVQREVLKTKLPKTITQIGGGCEKAFEQIKKLY